MSKLVVTAHISPRIVDAMGDLQLLTVYHGVVADKSANHQASLFCAVLAHYSRAQQSPLTLGVLNSAKDGALEVSRYFSTFSSLPDFAKRPVEVDDPVVFVEDAMGDPIPTSKWV